MSDTAAPAVSQEAKPKQAKKNHLSGGFFRFVLTRFLLIIPTVFILVTVVFFVMRATGDPISAALGGRLTLTSCKSVFMRPATTVLLLCNISITLGVCSMGISALR